MHTTEYVRNVLNALDASMNNLSYNFLMEVDERVQSDIENTIECRRKAKERFIQERADIVLKNPKCVKALCNYYTTKRYTSQQSGRKFNPGLIAAVCYFRDMTGLPLIHSKRNTDKIISDNNLTKPVTP